MSILKVNLKHLYQCRGLWLWHFLLLCQIPLIARPFRSPENEKFVGYLVISFFWPLVTVSLVKEILSKPFSFCLPGHRKIPRRVIFIIGSVINMIFGLVFLAHTELRLPYVLLVICAGGFMGMLSYLLGVFCVFSVRNSIVLIALLPLFIWPGVFFELYKPLEVMIIYSPVRVIVIGLLVCWLAWRWLAQPGFARRYCGQLALGISDVWNFEKDRRYRQARTAEQSTKKGLPVSIRLNRFFMTRMSSSGFLTRGQYIWGNLYVVIGRALGSSLGCGRWLVIVLLFMLMGYFPGREDISTANILFIVPVFGMVSLNLLPYSNILLPGGRDDKYYAAVISGFAVTLLTTLLVTSIAVMCILVEPVLPDIVLKGRVFSYHAMDAGNCWVCLSLIPIALLMATLFPRRNIVKMIFIMVVMYGWVFFGVFKPLVISRLFESVLSLPIGMTVVCWGIFLLALRYICMRRCLGGNG